MIQTLLIGTDESSEAGGAAAWASVLAQATGAAVTVVEAYQPAQAERPPAQGRRMRAEMQTRVKAWTDSVWPDRLDEPTTVAIEGEPLSVLSEAARVLGADVVVIGSKPFEGVSALGFGSLAHALAHHLECPLIAVPGPAARSLDGWIVADLQGSAHDDDLILEWCDELATYLGTRICEVRPAGRHPGLRSERLLPAAHERLERSGDDHAEVLRAVASERDTSLIVVAATEHHVLGRHPLEAVSDRLLHHPTRPVAVLPHVPASG